MNIILATAYDIDPYKGSESATGWNFVLQIARFNKVVAITRTNNRCEIERYIKEFDINISNIEFAYYDLPYYLRFWKKGARGSSLYFYLWQMLMPLFIIKNRLKFDIAHNVNFHADAFPTFLWIFKKPVVWGPINHHEKIPKEFMFPKKGFFKDRIKWYVKKIFWNLDPFLLISKLKVDLILGGNSSVKKRLNLSSGKFNIFSQVASNNVIISKHQKINEFNIIIAARFISLKGIDIALYAFDVFYRQLSVEEKKNVKLSILGKGPLEQDLKSIKNSLISKNNIEFRGWIHKEKMNSFYQNSNIFLFPSHEGAGMVVAEALSHGLPIICFDNYGPGELVNEQCAIKIPYLKYDQSITDFSSALLKIYRDKKLSNQMSKSARELFEEKYTWASKGILLEKLYNTIFEKKS